MIQDLFGLLRGTCCREPPPRLQDISQLVLGKDAEVPNAAACEKTNSPDGTSIEKGCKLQHQMTKTFKLPTSSNILHDIIVTVTCPRVRLRAPAYGN